MKHPFLTALDAAETEALTRLAREVRFVAGKSIFRQGDAADGFFVIEKGEVNLDYDLPGRKTVLIQKIGPGELLGLSWLFEPRRWEFSAVAVGDVIAKFFDAAEVRKECERDPRLGYKFMEAIAGVLIERLQATRHKLRVFVARASQDDEARQVC